MSGWTCALMNLPFNSYRDESGEWQIDVTDFVYIGVIFSILAWALLGPMAAMILLGLMALGLPTLAGVIAIQEIME